MRGRLVVAKSLGIVWLVAAAPCVVGACSGQADVPFGGGSGANGAGGGTSSGGGGAGASGATGGAAGSGGIGGTGGGATGGMAGAGGEAGSGGSCGTDVQPAQRMPLDLLVMVDQSASMEEDGKWTAMVSALQSFVSAPASGGTGVGLQYFPAPPADASTIPMSCATDPECGLYGPCVPMIQQCSGYFSLDSSCDPLDYRSPEEPIGVLPAVQPQLTQSLQSHDSTGSSTPTEPAMRGAVSYATDWAEAHPDHLTAILLATDGDPTNCTTNTLAGVATAAAEALAALPSVRTHVIGIGQLFGSLDPVAQAGGTGQPHLVAAGSAQQFLDVLISIRNSNRCTYRIPPPAQGPTDYGQVNVIVTDPNQPANPTTIPNVANRTACHPNSGGWYYDGPGTPGSLVLCAASCVAVMSSALAVSVQHGCPTVH